MSTDSERVAEYQKHHPEVHHRYKRTPAARWSALKSKAKQKGLVVSITRDQHSAMILLPCHYCGGVLPETSAGVDRVNSSLGYLPGNVVPCCSDCNYGKNDLPLAKFLDWVERVHRHMVKG